MFFYLSHKLSLSIRATLSVVFISLFLFPSAKAQGEYEPGSIILKLTTFAVNEPNFLIQPPSGTNTQSGLVALDSALSIYGQSEFRSPTVTPQNTILASQLGLDRYFIATVDDSTNIEILCQQLMTLADVEDASPDWFVEFDSPPNDPLYESQWGHDNQRQFVPCMSSCGPDGVINGECDHDPNSSLIRIGTIGFDSDVDLAWDEIGSFGDIGIIIGVLDRGVDYGHPDFQGANILPGIVTDGTPDTISSGGHGTTVTGIIASVANNGIGAAGVASGCSILPLRLPPQVITLSFLANGIILGTDSNVNIINMSNHVTDGDFLESAVDYAYSQNVTLIAASGNGGCGSINFPAAYPHVISVGAASPCGERKRGTEHSLCKGGECPDALGVTCDGDFWGSEYGEGLDLIAPSMIPTTIDGGGYIFAFGGTSASTPFVSGIAGLLLSKQPTLTPDEVRALLQAGAVDIGVGKGNATEGYDIYTGYGMVNALNSLRLITVKPPNNVALNDFSSGTEQGVEVSWQDDEAIETGWLIERKLSNSSNWTVVVTLNTNLTDSVTWKDNTALGSESYDYRVTVKGVHVVTNPLSATFSITTKPHLPRNVSASVTIISGTCLGGFGAESFGFGELLQVAGPGGGDTFIPPFTEGTDQIVVSWVASTNQNQNVAISHYKLQRTDLSDASTTDFDSLTGPSYAVCGNVLNRDYAFTMWAIDENGGISLQTSPTNATTGCLAYCAQGPSSKLSTQEDALLPRVTELVGNYPNPFNPSTNISFTLAGPGHVRITVYNILGQQVVTLVDNPLDAGQYNVNWDGRGYNGDPASSGMYFYRLVADGVSMSKKMLLLK